MTVIEMQKTKCDLSVLHVESLLSQNCMSFILIVRFIIVGIYCTGIHLILHKAILRVLVCR